MGKLAVYRENLTHLGVVGFLARAWARRWSGRSVLFSKHSVHPLIARGASSDLHVFHQIFIEREYRCLDGLTGVRTIVDAGANVGYSSAYLLSRFPEARVVAIEPDPANCEILKENLRRFGNRAIVRQAALWSEPTTLDFSESTTGEGDEWGREVNAANGAGTIEALDMPSIFETYGLGEIDLLKIDIEGAEKTVFSAPDLSWLDRVRNIVIELHGDECREPFMRAIATRDYAISECGELTVCLSKS